MANLLLMQDQIKNILFVCTGNTCRSSFAAALARKLLAEKELSNINLDSAGLLVLSGGIVPPIAQKVALEYDVDLSTHQTKALSETIISQADIVVVMEKAHKEALLARFSETMCPVLLARYFAQQGSRNRSIADPYGKQYDAYRFCYEDIKDAVSGLVYYLANRRISFDTIEVNCYGGYKANETPKSFCWNGTTFEIKEILDRWYQGGLDPSKQTVDYFKVRTHDGADYIIRYDHMFDAWALKLE